MIVTIDRHGVWTTRCPSTPHTLATCVYKRPCECRYVEGKEPPHFPVPAIPIRVGYMPADSTQPIAPCAYWYVSSDRLLWSIWKYEGLGNITMTIEYADTDDIEIRTI